jgi:hypothetical protein
MKVISSTANEAISNMTTVLARHYTKGPAARAELRKWLDEIESPVTYSNQDIDRASGFADFLAKLTD